MIAVLAVGPRPAAAASFGEVMAGVSEGVSVAMWVSSDDYPFTCKCVKTADGANHGWGCKTNPAMGCTPMPGAAPRGASASPALLAATLLLVPLVAPRGA